MMRELEHRVKKLLLSTVQVIAHQPLKSAEVDRAIYNSLSARPLALSDAYA